MCTTRISLGIEYYVPVVLDEDNDARGSNTRHSNLVGRTAIGSRATRNIAVSALQSFPLQQGINDWGVANGDIWRF